jgi:hypothetical protein
MNISWLCRQQALVVGETWKEIRKSGEPLENEVKFSYTCLCVHQHSSTVKSLYEM